MRETESKNPMYVGSRDTQTVVSRGLTLVETRHNLLPIQVFRLLGVHARPHQAHLFHLQH